MSKLVKVSSSNDRIRKIIDMKNLTLTQLSHMTGVAVSSISLYVNNKRTPAQNSIMAISSALNINPAWLMGYDVPMEQLFLHDVIDNITPDSDCDSKLIELIKIAQGLDQKCINILIDVANSLEKNI